MTRLNIVMSKREILKVNYLSIISYVRDHRPKKVKHFVKTLSRYKNVHFHQQGDITHLKVTYLYRVKRVDEWSTAYKPNQRQTPIILVSTTLVSE